MTSFHFRLGEQLRAAASEQLPARPAPSVPRRRVLFGVAAAVMVSPAALAASGVLDGNTDSGRFPDGSSFEVRTVPNPTYGSCEETEVRGPQGEFGGLSTACPADDPRNRPSDTLAVGWQVAPGGTLFLQGIAPLGTTRIEVSDAIGPVQFNRATMRFVAHVPGDADFTVVALDAEGEQLDRYDGPPEFWKFPGIPEPRSGEPGPR